MRTYFTDPANAERLTPVRTALTTGAAGSEQRREAVRAAIRTLVRESPDLFRTGSNELNTPALDAFIATHSSGDDQTLVREVIGELTSGGTAQFGQQLRLQITDLPQILRRLAGSPSERRDAVQAVLGVIRRGEIPDEATLQRALLVALNSDADQEIRAAIASIRYVRDRAQRPRALTELDYDGATGRGDHAAEARLHVDTLWNASPIARAFAAAGAPHDRGRLLHALTRLDAAVTARNWSDVATILASDLMDPSCATPPVTPGSSGSCGTTAREIPC